MKNFEKIFALFQKFNPEQKYSVVFVRKVGTTRLLALGRSPKYSDCLLSSMEQSKDEKIKCNKTK